MYINAVANSVMLQLYLQHDFYIIIFKVKHKLCITSGSSPCNDEFWVCAWAIASQLLTL